MCEHDPRQRIEDTQRRSRKAKYPHQRLVEMPVVSEEEDEPQRDDDRWQDERDHCERTDRPLPRKVVTGEDVRPDEADPQAEQGAVEGLDDGEPDQVHVVGIGDHARDGRQIPSARSPKRARQDNSERVVEDERQQPEQS